MQSIKDMRRTDWKRILERRYLTKLYQDACFDGVIALIKIDKITEPLYVKNSLGNNVKVVGEGYSWIEYAPKHHNWFLTSMFDENNQFIQLYFDINKGNDFSEITNPRFIDMYLDIVVDTNGMLMVLDEEELDDALNKGDINQETYYMTKKICDELYQELSINKQRYINLCQMLCIELNEELEKR